MVTISKLHCQQVHEKTESDNIRIYCSKWIQTYWYIHFIMTVILYVCFLAYPNPNNKQMHTTIFVIEHAINGHPTNSFQIIIACITFN